MIRPIVLLPLLLVGCGEAANDARPTGGAVATPGDVRPDSIPAGFTVRGVYVGSLYDSAAATVDHEAIPGVMPAMRMPIRVADRALLRGLTPGDTIRFRLTDTGDGYEIQNVEPLPPGTTLVLADRGAEAVPREAALADTSDTPAP